MKLSPETLLVLKNFATINRSIYIKQGKVLMVLSEGENFFAKAVVAEEFAHPVLIYEVNQLLGVLSLIANADVEIGDKSLKISSGSNVIEYLYADPFIVKETPEVRLTPDKLVLSCTLTNTVLETAQRAALLFSAKKCSIIGDGETAVMVVGNTSIATKTHNYKHVIGPCKEVFEYRFTLDNLKVLPDTYEVSLGSLGEGDGASGVMHLKGKLVQYWLAADPDSNL